MGALQRTTADRPHPRGLRARLMLAFLVPVLFLGVASAILVEAVARGAGDFVGMPLPLARGLYVTLILVAGVIAAALALQAGDRLTRPVAWLLRTMDAGQIRLLSQVPPPAADWEMEALCNRVRVLLRQNLSGAQAMEELDALRTEIEAVLQAAEAGTLDPLRWPAERATQPMTRRLLDHFSARGERARESFEGIARLRGLLEQDWRDETSSIAEIGERAERCFLQQTQAAVEIERLERLRAGSNGASGELPALLADVRLGFDRWRDLVQQRLRAAPGRNVAPGGADPPARLAEWDAWVAESLALLETQVTSAGRRQGDFEERVVAGLDALRDALAASTQEISGLSGELAQLQRAWSRLGERLRTLMVRVGEMCSERPGESPVLTGTVEKEDNASVG